MQLTMTDRQAELREQYQEFGKFVASRAAEAYQNVELDRVAWKKLADEGIWKIPVPQEYGGYGLTWWDFISAVEGLCTTAKDLGFLLSMIAHVGFVFVVLENGTEEQKLRYLPMMMNGGVGATAATEPQGGSDVARVATNAVYKEGGLLLNGHKAHITNAPSADAFVVVGRIPEVGKKDITLFLLERDMDGLSLGEREVMLGGRTSPTGDIFLKNVEIGEDNILGPVGEGLNVLYKFLTLDRLMYGVVSSAFTEPILQKSLEYANERVAFRAPIAEHQYIQHKLTEMKIHMETTRYVTYAALDKLLRGDKEFSMMGSIAKLVGAEGLFETAKFFLQIHGHTGYMQGEISQVLADTAGVLIAGGTSEMQRKNIFNQMQKLYGFGV